MNYTYTQTFKIPSEKVKPYHFNLNIIKFFFLFQSNKAIDLPHFKFI